MAAPSPERRVLLVRHGQSTWNAEGRWQGSADPPLSMLGEHQAAAAAEAVRAIGVARVVTSDLERARRTGELLCPAGTTVAVEAALRERHAGEWEGLTKTEIEAGYPGFLAAHRSPPGFEDDETLLARVLPAIEALLDVAPGQARGQAPEQAPDGVPDEAVDGPTLVVTHGGVIRTLERLLGAPEAAVPNLAGRWLRRTATEPLVLGEREVLIDPDVVALTVPDQL